MNLDTLRERTDGEVARWRGNVQGYVRLSLEWHTAYAMLCYFKGKADGLRQIARCDLPVAGPAKRATPRPADSVANRSSAVMTSTATATNPPVPAGRVP